MNKTVLKKFATKARYDLLKKIESRALKLGISADSIKKAEIESSDAIFIDGKQLSKEEQIQRNHLIERIKQTSFNRVMDEVAYTWFNRFTALRYMEINDYLPTKVRVLSSVYKDSSEPDMMKEALSLDLDLDKGYIYELKMENRTEELFKYLIIKHCNDLNRYMPFMFETIHDYTEILFPEGLLSADSFIQQMIQLISEDDWRQIEIIGWLYQYYIADEKDRVIKAKKKYTKEEIPFATQLFTPEWIVRYMVQNSLGRYWLESHPEHIDLKETWEYFLESRDNRQSFEEKLAPYINKELNVEDIKCFDPAMGSGHILVYMFDLLFEIYSKCGYMDREIPRLIIENNLYGLDIDKRAYQLASFSLVMKALEYNKRFLRSIERDGLHFHLASIQESNLITKEEIAYLAGEDDGENFSKVKAFIEQFKDAKTIGSLIKVKPLDSTFMKERMESIQNNDSNDLFQYEMRERTIEIITNLLKQSTIMGGKYDIFVTNPPYAGNKFLTEEVSNYLSNHYPDARADSFSAFIEYSFHATKPNGHIGFMTPFVWMFISTYEPLRKNIIHKRNISSLVQLEYSGFDEATVPICTFTLRNYHSDTKGEYVKLSDFRGSNNQPIKTIEAVQNPNVSYRYSTTSDSFTKIPGHIIAYWLKAQALQLFEGDSIAKLIVTREGMTTANNDLFLREWFEVDVRKIGRNINDREKALKSNKKWFPYQKGGPYRKWYGNVNLVVNWENDGEEIKKNIDDRTGRVRSHNYNGDFAFREGVTFPTISSGTFGARYSPSGYMFDAKGAMGFFESREELFFTLALMNTSVAKYFLTALAPTLDFKLNKIMALPLKKPLDLYDIMEDVKKCIEISKCDWDLSETAIDFLMHPILKWQNENTTIASAYEKHAQFLTEQFIQLKTIEERINKAFIDSYGLQGELSAELDEKDITIQELDLKRDIKGFISYAVGCIFGRYSLDEEGLIFAGGNLDFTQYKTFPVDKDNILPILPGPYFEDDIVSKLVDFVQITFGKERLNDNLNFIADAIGQRKSETARETLRRYFLNDFYKDHVQVYRKRPIYWLFTSGKEKAFNCLVYMHRYDKTTLSRIRTDYLHEYQIRLDAEKSDLINVIEGDSTGKDSRDARRSLKALERKLDELKAYDEFLHHMADRQIEIDLDDGMKANYDKFGGLVVKL